MEMFTPRNDSFESGDTVSRTFIWNEPDSPSQLSRSSSQSTSSYLFTRSGLRTPACQRPPTPLPAAHLTPRDITPKFFPGQIYPGGRGPATRRGPPRNNSINSLQLSQKRQFIFEDIDESVQEEQESPFAPALIDQNRNNVKVVSPAHGSPGIGQRTKTFIFDDDSVQMNANGYKRPPSVESIRLDDPRSPLLTSREAQKLCLGKKSSGKAGFTQNLGMVKGMLLCQCNCSSLRTKNRVGCLSDQYDEM
ncbi:uncharacterized protein LOC135464548 [Liolophura sinensis]|uniref:uncharacterized protein LOC135464548 n=1 Tax=Liolophura sinensis TaxID=3198878 RepID=UPI0031583078